MENYFYKFARSTFDAKPEAIQDGPDETAISCLSHNERTQAEKMVLDALKETRDYRPVRAAGMMRLAKASAILKQRLERNDTGDDLKIEIARALFLIEHYPQAQTMILDILQNTADKEAGRKIRSLAVQALKDFDTVPEAVQVLFQTIEDEDIHIGFVSAGVLKTIFRNDVKISKLLGELQELKAEPAVDSPESIRKRKTIFKKLEGLTHFKMPVPNKPVQPKTEAKDQLQLF